MDWNLVLFIFKWAAISLFYSVLLLLLFGVYREMARPASKVLPPQPAIIGRLRVMNPGDDPQMRVGLVLNLSKNTNLGAEKDNDIILRDSYVSGHHARLRWDGIAWWVEDLNSKNGTEVNHKPCAPGLSHPLPYGAILSIGDMAFQLLSQDES